MKRNVVRMFVLLMMLSFLGVHSIHVKAAGPRDGEIVGGTLLTSESAAAAAVNDAMIDTGNVRVPRGSEGLLAGGTAMIIVYDMGRLRIGGETIGWQICDSVKMYLYLERLEGVDWYPVYHKFQSAANDHYTSYDTALTVDPGYYRVVATHIASLGTISESNYSETDAIYITDINKF